MLKQLKEVWAGFLVGVANIIPGVSGGTLLFLLGLYERTIGAVSGFGGGRGAAFFKQTWAMIARGGRKDERVKFLEMSNALDIPFLVRLVGGAGLAILLLSGVMNYLLTNQFSNTYAFFFGLIAISAVLSMKMLRAKKAVLIIHVLFGAFVTVAMTLADNPVDAAQMRSERYKERYLSEQTKTSASENGNLIAADESSKTRFKYLGVYGVRDFALATASGVAAVCAMILPGLSGSLMLILFGQYHEVISAISNLRTLQLDYFVFLSIIGVGMIAGLLLFAKVVEFVFKKFHDGTVAVLIGLMLGSLYALWPFKETFVMSEQYVKDGNAIRIIENTVIQTNVNILPQDLSSGILAFVLCAVGVGLMLVLEKRGAR